MYVELVERFIGKTGPLIRHEIEKGAIRKFAQATFETDPIYYDEEYAKNTPYGRIIAPSTFFRSLFFGDIPGFDLPRLGRVHAEQEYFFYRPVCAGDVVYCQNKIVKTYEKEGRSGFMLFVVFEHATYDENMQPYNIGLNTTLFKEEILKNPAFRYVPEGEKAEKKLPFDIVPLDVSSIKVGDCVGPIVLPPVTKTKIAQWGGATGDYNPIHFEDAAATTAGLPSVIAHGMIGVAIAGNVVNHWLAGKGIMKNLKTRFASPILPDDVLTMHGEIVEIVEIDGQPELGCEIVLTNERSQTVLKFTVRVSLCRA